MVFKGIYKSENYINFDKLFINLDLDLCVFLKSVILTLNASWFLSNVIV